MLTPREIETLLPPWKGGVLTAWQRGLGFCSSYCIILLFIHRTLKNWRLRRGSNPRPPAWQAGTLTNWATEPYIWWKQQGSNLWPSACKADALPAELCFRNKWWPLGESNPCYHRERVVSWPLDQGAIIGASCRSRTNNLLITSQLLCHWANEAHYYSLIY